MYTIEEQYQWNDEVWQDLVDYIVDGRGEEKAIIAERWANRRKKSYRKVSFSSNKANPKKGENHENTE